MIDVMQAALISGLVSTVMIGSAVKYIDRKIAKAEEEKKRKERFLQRKSIASSNVRAAQGKVIYWVVRGLKHPPPNGELDAAMEEYKRAEDEYKAINQQILAEFEV